MDGVPYEYVVPKWHCARCNRRLVTKSLKLNKVRLKFSDYLKFSE
jgi:hypothetical protein